MTALEKLLSVADGYVSYRQGQTNKACDIIALQTAMLRRCLEALKWYRGGPIGKEHTHWRGDNFFLEDKFGVCSSAQGAEVATECLAELEKLAAGSE